MAFLAVLQTAPSTTLAALLAVPFVLPGRGQLMLTRCCHHRPVRVVCSSATLTQFRALKRQCNALGRLLSAVTATVQHRTLKQSMAGRTWCRHGVVVRLIRASALRGSSTIEDPAQRDRAADARRTAPASDDNEATSRREPRARPLASQLNGAYRRSDGSADSAM